MPLSTLIALLQDAATPPTGAQSTVKLVSGTLAVVLIIIIVLRRRRGKGKKEEEEF